MKEIKAKKGKIGCGTIILIIIALGVFGSITSKSSAPVRNPATLKEVTTQRAKPSIDWKKLSESIIADYQGKVISIEQLNYLLGCII